MLWKEREKWRINTGEIKVTDGERERETGRERFGRRETETKAN